MPFLSVSLRAADLLGAVLLARRLAAHDAWSAAQLAAHQRQAFLRLVRHAKAASPFYRDLYRNIELADDLPPARLPITDKRRLMDHFDAVAADCPFHAGLHLFEDTVMVEIVGDDYRVVSPGEMGTRWLLTNLYNLTEPLIRYDVTDMLSRSAEPCACGRPFGLVQTIGGRAEDMLRLPRSSGDGEVLVSPMVVSLAIESFPGIREYAAEHDAAGIRVRLVVPDTGDRALVGAELPRRLRFDIERHGAAAPPVALEFVDAIERSAQRMGKLSIVARRRAPAAANAAQ